MIIIIKTKKNLLNGQLDYNHKNIAKKIEDFLIQIWGKKRLKLKLKKDNIRNFIRWWEIWGNDSWANKER